MTLNRRQMKTVAAALVLAIEWDETAMHCHETQYHGDRMIVPPQDRKSVAAMGRRVERNKRLLEQVKAELRRTLRRRWAREKSERDRDNDR